MKMLNQSLLLIGSSILLLQHADAFALPKTRIITTTPSEVSSSGSTVLDPTSSRVTTRWMQSAAVAEGFSLNGDDVDEFDASPDGLITRAKVVMASDLGVQNGGLLADTFLWIGPLLDTPLNKVDYLAAGRFFDLRSTFPDLDYRAHDYRIDEVDPLTVRVTARTVGTMRGELRLRDQTLPPNGQQMRCPPEAVSITFDGSSGKVVKLVTGFTLDRLVGNTNGLCGVSAAATVAGEPPSEWEVYPALTVVQRFVGRPVAPIGESSSFLAPFPETVMIQLAKGVLSSNMAADDASLLSKDFTYMTPTQGPVGKKKFLETFAAMEFESVEPELSYFRVDPYDPNRVWVDVRPLAPGYEGPAQAMSFAFDDDGFCTRITSGAVMDPSLGNAGGLGGPEGYKYARGEPSPGIITRPLPRVISRLQKRALSPITKIDVDEYALPDVEVRLPRRQGKATKPVETLSSLKATRVVEQKAPPPPAPVRPPPSPTSPPTVTAPKIEMPKAPKISIPKPAAVAAPTKQAEATKRPTFTIPKMPKMPTFDAPEQARPKVPVSKPAPKPAPVKKGAPKPAPVKKRPTLTIPKMPKMPSFEAPAPARPKVAAQKSVPKVAPVKKKPTLTIPKIPSFGAPTPSQPKVQPRVQGDVQSAANLKASEQKKKEAEANKRRELEQAQLRREAQAKEIAEKRRFEAEEKKALMEAEKTASAEEARRKQEQLKAQQAEKQAQQEALMQKQVEAKQAAEQQAEERAAMQKSLQEAKQAAQVEERRQLEESRRQQQESQKAAAEQRKREAEEKREALAEERRQQQEAKKFEADQRKIEGEKLAEEKRAAQARVRQEQEAAKKLQAERRQAELEARKQSAAKEAERKRAAAAATSTATKARPGASISLFGLGGGESASKPAPKPAAKPRPTINLFGGGASKPATKIPVSKPRPTLNLFGGGEPAASKPAAKTPVSKPRPTINLFGGGQPAAAKAPVSEPRPTINLFGSGEKPASKTAQQKSAVSAAKKAKPGASISLFGLGGGNEDKESKAKQQKAAVSAAAKAKPGASISLFGMGGAPSPPAKPAPKKPAAAKAAPKAAPKAVPRPTAPRGVPTISGWKKGGDKSITGSISGSPNFSNGERVTTSPITQGEIASGKVVKTASGSRYFLS